jgi:hypothetical protein
MEPTLHIELDGGAPPGDEERVSKLVDEIDADWEVRRSWDGVGVDPTSALVVIAVPFGIFVKKFLELAATDAYEAMKDWLVRLSQRRHAVEIRDPWGSVIQLPPDATPEAYLGLLPALASAMRKLGEDLEAQGTEASLDEAEGWYRRAAESGNLDAILYLIDLQERRGGEARLREAKLWYERGGASMPRPAIEEGLELLRAHRARRQQGSTIGHQSRAWNAYPG